MESESKAAPPNDSTQPTDPAQHVAGAHQLLKSLGERLGLEKHPELQEAITKLELALGQLSINTGGMF
jgi:hypothetical protein